jgi:hypothetical protein
MAMGLLRRLVSSNTMAGSTIGAKHLASGGAKMTGRTQKANPMLAMPTSSDEGHRVA